MFMGDSANVLNGFLKHAMGRRISDHAASQFAGIFLGLCPEIFHVNVTIFSGFDGDNFPADHLGRGRVGAVGRRWDQADIAMPFTARHMIIADGDEARIFSLST